MASAAEEFLTYDEWDYVAHLISYDVTEDLAAIGPSAVAVRQRVLLKVTNIMAQLKLAAERERP